MNRSGARAGWFVGFVIGVLGGFLLLELPPLGLAIVVAAALLARLAGQALAGIGGLLAGIGVIWLATLGRIKLTCTEAVGCFAPGIDGYLTVAVALLVLGGGVSAVAIARARQRG